MLNNTLHLLFDIASRRCRSGQEMSIAGECDVRQGPL